MPEKEFDSLMEEIFLSNVSMRQKTGAGRTDYASFRRQSSGNKEYCLEIVDSIFSGVSTVSGGVYCKYSFQGFSF